jgi:phenylacetate-CoA ligase
MKPAGRMDMMTKIGLGQKVYPLLFDEALLSFPEVISYQLLIDKDGYKDKLTFVVESRDQSDGLKASIVEAVSAIREIKMGLEEELIDVPSVQFRAVQNEYVSKAKVIVDRRPLFDN